MAQHRLEQCDGAEGGASPRTSGAVIARRQCALACCCALSALLASACPSDSRPRPDGGTGGRGSGAGAQDASYELAADGGGDAATTPTPDASQIDASIEIPADGGADAAAPDASSSEDAASSSGDDAGGEEQSFTVSAFMPDGELAQLDAPLRVSFSAAVDPSSVNATSFSVARGAGSVEGDLSVESDAVVFRPRPAWVLAASYTVELTAAIRDVAGRALVPRTHALRVRDGKWSVEQRAPARQQPRSDLVVAPNGSAAVAWIDQGVHVSLYSPKTGWTAPERVSDEVDGVLYPSLAINQLGQIVASWNFMVNPVGRVYLPEGGWQPPFYFRGVPGGGQEVRRATWMLSDAGDAVSVFSVYRSPPVERGTIDAVRFKIGSDAREVHAISVSDTGYDADPHLCWFGEEPVFVWVEDIRSNPDQPRPEVWLRQGVTGEPKRVSSEQAVGRSPAIAAAVDRKTAWLVWEEVKDGQAAVWASRLGEDGTRSMPERISQPYAASDLEANPALAIDRSGVVHVVWEQPPAAIWTARRDVAGAWRSPLQLSAAGAPSTQPSIALEAGGNAWVMWAATQRGSGMDADSAPVMTARYLVPTGWTEATELASGDRGCSMVSDRVGLTIALDQTGGGWAAWTGNNHFNVARFE